MNDALLSAAVALGVVAQLYLLLALGSV